ncbi:hypothetical protein [Mucilaginibacter sp. 22184]|uniref:hypothetical protein n=1 Tax=Mucilaginibacter sp. 22184 TaxID=3453887 RepID=UPI003F82A6FC
MRKLALLFVVLMCTGCEYFDSRLRVVNESPLTVSVYDINDTNSVTQNNIEYYQSNVIHPKDTAALTKPGKNEWTNYIEGAPEKRLYLYFFDIDTLNRYQHKADMNYLIESKKYLKRVDFTLDQLNQMNWEIHYKN